MALDCDRVHYRPIADGVFWVGGCLMRDTQGKVVSSDAAVHIHANAYLIRGRDRSLLFDSGNPEHWTVLEPVLDELLEGRPLDWVAPSHPELPHAGNIERLFRKYPEARLVGDARDYHLYYPRLADRLVMAEPGTRIDLGGGHEFVFRDALIKDLPNTLWGFEPARRILFVADGFSYVHNPPAWVAGGTPHGPGQCWLTSDELAIAPSVEQAAFITRSALYWTRYVDFEPVFEQVDALVAELAPNMIAPAHGNVIVGPERLLPVIREAHAMAYSAATGRRPSAGEQAR
ncbi:MAG TPA: MBL fold metallo-hydrolase [Candidatus Dormibacteraeota bacterium]|jgi:flavorubredoxin|nr:MBL fold metallo-hydrolase [Candidatus Dormibacteraeota bacterium]